MFVARLGSEKMARPDGATASRASGATVGILEAARAQAEVKRSRSQGSRHIPRGLPLQWQAMRQVGAKQVPVGRWPQMPEQPRSRGAGVPFLCSAGGRGRVAMRCGSGCIPTQGMQELEARDTASGVRLIPFDWSRPRFQPTSCRVNMRSVRLCCMQVSWIRSRCASGLPVGPLAFAGLLFGSPLRAEC